MIVKTGKWAAGLEPDIIEYAKLSFLFEETTLSKTHNSVMVLSMYYQVPCSTIRERIRKARELGLLTQPGKGNFAKSYMTDKCKQILEEN